jgi:hypothetical protein
MEKTIPKFMTHKRDIIRFLFFVLIWAIAFAFVYRPNVAIRGLEYKEHQYVYYISSMIGLGYIILCFSRWLFYTLNRKQEHSVKFFYFWIVMEFLVISVGLSLFGWSLNVPNTRSLGIIFPRTILAVVSLLFIPYLISWLYFSLEEKKIQLNEILKYQNKHVEAGMVHFLDEKKVLRLSLRIDDLLYVQSADNYVYIYYTNNKNDIVKFLLRNTLKSVEEAFSSIGLIRCHRFYVVNSKKVSLLRKTKEGLVLELATDTACEIPVSKTYLSKVADFFTS